MRVTCAVLFRRSFSLDGLSTDAKYNQKFSNNNLTDDPLFAASMVPMYLKVKNTSETVWMNPHTSSPKRCIPIMIKYAKETKELMKSEINSIKTQIQKLRPTTITTTNGVYIVTTEIHAWIRFMECILHIAYRLEIRK